MEHHHHGAAILGQTPGQGHDFELVAYVQEGGGLVHEDGRGVLGQRHGQIDLLPLPAAQLPHVAVGHPGGVRQLEGAVHRGMVLLAVTAGIG